MAIMTAVMQPAALLALTIGLGFWFFHLGWVTPITVVAFALVWVGIPEGLTGLVGPSGGGKSTVTRLAARFWDVDEGSITIGGVDVRDIPTTKLMEMTSMVFRDVYLFNTTITENVQISRPDATDAEVADALHRAGLDQTLSRLPDGAGTQVGEGGQKLSGAERQRVSIARAFLKDAPILLLDEITSALDAENEAAITATLGELSRAGRSLSSPTTCRR